MKRIITASLVAGLAISGAQASSLSDKLTSLETELASLKKQVKKQNKKINEVKAHDSGDNIKWGVDFRTAIDNINYDMADGTDRGNKDLMSMRLWLNMAYAPDAHNVFKGQLAMHKAFGADFIDPFTTPGGSRALSMGSLFDWTGNEALSDNNLRVRQAYWLYLGDKAFGADMPWTFSLGRRPSAKGFLAHLRDDDAPQSPLAHVINVEFDGLSSKLDLSNVTGIPGMSIKLCAGQGSTNAAPLFARTDGTTYSEEEGLEDITLAGFIFEPYNDGQFIVKATWYRAYDVPGFDSQNFFTAFNAGTPSAATFDQFGDMDGAALSVLVDGLTDEGYFADVKVFGSLAWTKTRPGVGSQMLGVTVPSQMFPGSTYTYGAEAGESKTGTSYWFGAQLPVTDGETNYGTLGLEYNHGSEYWRPFTYSEDTMIGSKIAARGDAWEAYYTYQINDALSAQVRYTSIDYDYTGSNGFFGSGGVPMDIDQVKSAFALTEAYGYTPADMGAMAADTGMTMAQVEQTYIASSFAGSVVDKAQDLRFYLRYRF